MRKLRNDELTDRAFYDLLFESFTAMYRVLKPGGSIYVAHSDFERKAFTQAFTAAGFKMSLPVIWKKNAFVLSRSPYQSIHEPILFGWRPGAKHRWYGGRKQTSVQEWGDDLVEKMADGRYQIKVGDRLLIVDGAATLQELEPSIIRFDKPVRHDLHPTMKPTGLVARMLANSARRGDLVIDGFAGSGSTLIAADGLGMSARVMDLEPANCDVIVMRWQQATGRRAVHAETGKEYPNEPQRAAA
jgi:DNA modification methylase